MDTTWQRLVLPDTQLEALVWGHGEPVVFIQTALTADELLPMARDGTLAGFRKIVYHRRGYGGSAGVTGPGSIARDATDCARLLKALGVTRAHVVGLSFSAAIAVQIAADRPTVAATLTLIEPPPIGTPSEAAFRAANRDLHRSRRERGPVAALDDFLRALVGPAWRRVTEEQLPGSAEQMARDAATFFDSDLPALLRWRPSAADVARVACPTLSVGARDSGRWFAESRALLRQWFPDGHEVVIPDADHTVALTHPAALAGALAGFLQLHPIDQREG